MCPVDLRSQYNHSGCEYTQTVHMFTLGHAHVHIHDKQNTPTIILAYRKFPQTTKQFPQTTKQFPQGFLHFPRCRPAFCHLQYRIV